MQNPRQAADHGPVRPRGSAIMARFALFWSSFARLASDDIQTTTSSRSSSDFPMVSIRTLGVAAASAR